MLGSQGRGRNFIAQFGFYSQVAAYYSLPRLKFTSSRKRGRGGSNSWDIMEEVNVFFGPILDKSFKISLLFH